MVPAVFSVFALCSLIYEVKANCPTNLPLEIEGRCFRLFTEPLRWKDAVGNCPKLDSDAVMISVKTKAVMDKMTSRVKKLVEGKLKKALFWIGLYTDDASMSKKAKERNWKWNYDDSIIVQKDYTLWDKPEGTGNKGLSCAALNTSNDFLIQAVDCGGPRVPVICQMKEGDECTDSIKPYLMYEGHCLASLNGALEYNKIIGACSPAAPTQYLEDLKEAVILAAKNSFLGGGIFMNIKKTGGKFIELSDGSEISADAWEEDEPRDLHDCAGLSIQRDYSLKLKTMNCDMLASSICAIKEDLATPGQD